MAYGRVSTRQRLVQITRYQWGTARTRVSLSSKGGRQAEVYLRQVKVSGTTSPIQAFHFLLE